MNRRQFLLGAAAALAGVAGYSRYVEPAWLRLERVDVPVAALPSHLDGYTIGVLADLHLGRLVPVERGREAARRLADLKPDLVLVAGDMAGEVDSTEEAQRVIDEGLEPVKGAYGVLGNWDYYRSGPMPMGVKRQSTVKLLVNQGVEVAPGLWVAGLDEGLFGRPDVAKALKGAPPGAVRILLAHEPDLADLVRPEHKIALQISGHTHGGQIRLPFLGPMMLPLLGRKYVAGLYQTPGCPVYVSRGIGMTKIPVRFLCPPEITLIRLRKQRT